jgi:hypothetical protein
MIKRQHAKQEPRRHKDVLFEQLSMQDGKWGDRREDACPECGKPAHGTTRKQDR